MFGLDIMVETAMACNCCVSAERSAKLNHDGMKTNKPSCLYLYRAFARMVVV